MTFFLLLPWDKTTPRCHESQGKGTIQKGHSNQPQPKRTFRKVFKSSESKTRFQGVKEGRYRKKREPVLYEFRKFGRKRQLRNGKVTGKRSSETFSRWEYLLLFKGVMKRFSKKKKTEHIREEQVHKGGGSLGS